MNLVVVVGIIVMGEVVAVVVAVEVLLPKREEVKRREGRIRRFHTLRSHSPMVLPPAVRRVLSLCQDMSVMDVK